MIYINTEGEKPIDAWCYKAEELTKKLNDLDSTEERKKLIAKNKDLWRELKAWLLKLSHGKCWYSEAKEIFSFYDVDHFRPKSCAKQLDGTKREGYWWLAFDWRNYRISGNIGNRPNSGEDGRVRGKRDYFPLKAGSSVAISPEYDLRDEIIYLLDPTDPDDPVLLTFDESGYPKPAASDETWGYERAKTTIELLHLDYRPLVDERKKIWTNCSLLIREAQNSMKEQSEVISATEQEKVKNIFKKLREMVSEEAELSSTARACLLSSGNDWARNIV